MTEALKTFGYYFNDNDQLRTVAEDEPFAFTDQKNYEELGDLITNVVYEMLEDRCGLERIPLKPSDRKEDEDLSFIFASKDYDKKDTILVLLHGSGVVRAGQWARRLIINDSLTTGTQFPYIERALKNEWGVVVFNTNENGTADEDYEYSETPITHAKNAWNWFVKPSKAEKIYIVAHSRGGHDLSTVLAANPDEKRVSLVCLTDAPYFEAPKSMPLIAVNFLARGKYNSSSYNIQPYQTNRVVELYAGTNTHELSNHTSIDSVFHIFENDMSLANYTEVLTTAKELVLGEKNKKEKKDEGSAQSSVITAHGNKKNSDGDDDDEEVASKKARVE